MKSQFVYVSYIRTTREQLWQELTTPELITRYWAGMHTASDWKKGSSWTMTFPDGRVADTGEIVDFSPPSRMVIKWRNDWKPEMKEEGFSRCTFDLEPMEGAVKLSVKHEIDVPNSRFIEAVSGGMHEERRAEVSWLSPGVSSAGDSGDHVGSRRS